MSTGTYNRAIVTSLIVLLAVYAGWLAWPWPQSTLGQLAVSIAIAIPLLALLLTALMPRLGAVWSSLLLLLTLSHALTELWAATERGGPALTTAALALFYGLLYLRTRASKRARAAAASGGAQ